jgi:MFS family permease
MKLNVLFIITAILGLFYGLLMLLIPGAFSDFYGGELTNAGKYNGQLVAAAYLGFATLLFIATKAKEAKARQAIVMGSLVSFIVGLIISLRWQIIGEVNVWGWTTVGIFALLTLGYAYFLLTKKTD